MRSHASWIPFRLGIRPVSQRGPRRCYPPWIVSDETNPGSKQRVWARARVRLFSDTLTRQQMSDRLGIQSDPARELRSGPRLWLLGSRLEKDRPLDDQIMDVLDQLEGKQDVFLAIQPEAQAELFIGTNGAVSQTGMWLELPSSIVARMAEFGLALGADLYDDSQARDQWKDPESD